MYLKSHFYTSIIVTVLCLLCVVRLDEGAECLHASLSTVARTMVMSSGFPPLNCNWFCLAFLANGESCWALCDSLTARATMESTVS